MISITKTFSVYCEVGKEYLHFLARSSYFEIRRHISFYCETYCSFTFIFHLCRAAGRLEVDHSL
jgi:hypothetical protein